MAMTSYLDFAENDYKYFMTSYEYGIVANAMAADAQDHDTLKKHLVEECAEVLEAIDDHDTENLCEELGDVLFQVMFHSEIEAEQGNFTVDDVVNGICEKMIRRHPRVFGGEIPEVENEKDLWEAIKKQEREEKRKRAAAH